MDSHFWMDSNRQRREGRARNEILMQSGVWKIIMELHYGTIKPKERRHYWTKRKMNVLRSNIPYFNLDRFTYFH